MKTLTVKLARSHRAILAAMLLSGCQSEKGSESTVLVERQSERPTLASARDAPITLFGSLPGRGEIRYAGRSGGSMLQHSFTHEGADFDADISGAGDRLVFASTRHHENPDIYIKRVDATAVTQLTSDTSADIQPAFSPDNQRIAFASDRAGNWDIWIIDINGQHPIQVTDSAMDEVHPTWSLDGQRIVYSALPPNTGQWELWVSPAQAKASSTFIGYGVFPEWSPVDDTILFQRARQRGSRWYSIWTVRLADGEPLYPTEVASSSHYALVTPSWSRDGRFIAYTSVETSPAIESDFGASYQASDVWVMDADGGLRARLTDGHTANFSPTWGAHDRLFFTSTRSGAENIWSVKATMGEALSHPVARTAPGHSSVITTGAPAARREGQERRFGD